jgi:hypothetical protein
LASATQEDLYNISKKNGCDLSYAEWAGGLFTNAPGGADNSHTAGVSGFFSNDAVAAPNGFVPTGLVGSVLCLDWGIDIGLDDLHSPGEILNSQLQITANFINVNQTEDIFFTMYIVTVSEGTWTIENLNSIPQIGVLSKEDILNSRRDPAINYKATDSIYGGDFVTKLKHFGRNALAGIKTVLPYVADAAKIIATVAPLIGLGEGEGVMMGGVPVGGEGARAHRKKGGKVISRAELHRRLEY